MKRIIMVKSKTRTPDTYAPLLIGLSDNNYYLGGSLDAVVVVANNRFHARRIMNDVKKRFKYFNLTYYTRRLQRER